MKWAEKNILVYCAQTYYVSHQFSFLDCCAYGVVAAVQAFFQPLMLIAYCSAGQSGTHPANLHIHLVSPAVRRSASLGRKTFFVEVVFSPSDALYGRFFPRAIIYVGARSANALL